MEKSTKRLLIRPLRKGDYHKWVKANSTMQPKFNRWDRENRPLSELSRAKFQKLLKEQQQLREADDFYDFAVFYKKTGEIIGGVSAMNVVRSVSHSAYLGYSIYNQHWGQGFGKEAVKGMLDIAFRQLNLHRMEAGIERYNIRSIRLAKSLGMVREGTKRKAVYLRGEWQDLVVYSILAEDFGFKWQGQVKPRGR